MNLQLERFSFIKNNNYYKFTRDILVPFGFKIISRLFRSNVDEDLIITGAYGVNAAYNNLKIIEIPVSMNSRKYGTSNIVLPELIISIFICILDYMLKKFKLDIKII